MARNRNVDKIKALEADWNKLRRRLPNKIAIAVVNFFKRNFRVGGFVDKPFTKWDAPKNPKKTRSTLVESGTLRRGIKKIKVTLNRVVVGVSKFIKYAQIHNEGGKIPITPKMRRKFWAMYKESGNVFYKNMALTQKTHIDMPERRYIGDSAALDITLQRMLRTALKTLQK